MAARALAAGAGGEALRAFVRSARFQPLVAIEWSARRRIAGRKRSADPSEIRASVPIRRAKMSKFPTRISAARRNAEALLSRSKKQESTLKLEQEREHDAMVEKKFVEVA